MMCAQVSLTNDIVGFCSIMWRKDLTYAISELQLPIHTYIIMAIYITMSDKVPLVFVNAYLPTTNESVSDYREHLDNLQIVYNTICNDSIVIICGYLNVNSPQYSSNNCAECM